MNDPLSLRQSKTTNDYPGENGPEDARLNRALDILLECLLGSNGTDEPEIAEAREALQNELEGPSLEDGCSSSASKSDRRRRLPPPDFNT
jgi:hypothetical protein